MMEKRKLTTLILLILWVLATSFSISLINTLNAHRIINNPRWGHILFETASRQIYALQIMSGRKTQLKNKLNLGDNDYSLHVLYLLKKHETARLSVDITIPDHSWGGIIFDKTPEHISGVIFSKNSYRKSLFFQTDSKLKFTKTQPIDLANFSHEKTLHTEAVFKQNEIKLFINGKFAGNWEHTLPASKSVGVLTGSFRCEFDNFKLYAGKNLTPFFEQTFDLPRPSVAVFLNTIPPFALLAAIAFWLLTKPGESGPKRKIVCEILLMVLLALLSFPAILYFNDFTVENYITQLDEKNIHYTMGPLMDKLKKNDELYSIYRNNNKTLPQFLSYGKQTKDTTNIVVIGDSQTWGDGSIPQHKAFVEILYDLLTANMPECNFVCFNHGNPGASPCDQLEKYRKEILRLDPDVCMLNIGYKNNVVLSTSPLKESIEGFLELNKQHGVKTVIILEPVNPEDNIEEDFFKKHLIRPALANNVPVWNLNNYLIDKNNQGFVWIDRIHLSPYGHSLAAAYITYKTLLLLKGQETSDITEENMNDFKSRFYPAVFSA